MLRHERRGRQGAGKRGALLRGQCCSASASTAARLALCCCTIVNDKRQAMPSIVLGLIGLLPWQGRAQLPRIFCQFCGMPTAAVRGAQHVSSKGSVALGCPHPGSCSPPALHATPLQAASGADSAAVFSAHPQRRLRQHQQQPALPNAPRRQPKAATSH